MIVCQKCEVEWLLVLNYKEFACGLCLSNINSHAMEGFCACICQSVNSTLASIYGGSMHVHHVTCNLDDERNEEEFRSWESMLYHWDQVLDLES